MSIRQRTIAGLTPGTTFTVTRTFSEPQVEQFADMTRDYNPIHFDARFVAVKGLKSRICHGLLVGSMVTEVGGQIGWLASGMNFRFKRPVYMGETITCTLTITEIDEKGRARAEAVLVNQEGEVVITAHLAGRVPGQAEIQVLSRMVEEGDPTNGLR
ncbi:MAG: MaoC family dehydratase [Pseudomonadota bacterium]